MLRIDLSEDVGVEGGALVFKDLYHYYLVMGEMEEIEKKYRGINITAHGLLLIQREFNEVLKKYKIKADASIEVLEDVETKVNFRSIGVVQC